MPLEPRTAELLGSVAGSLRLAPADVLGVVEFGFCSYNNWWSRNDHPCGEYLPGFLRWPS